MPILNIDALTKELAKEAEAEIKAKVNELFQKIAEEIKIDLVERAAADVYGVYSPEIYERRGTLSDPSNYSVSNGDLLISVTPVAEFNRAYGGWNYGNELGGFMNFGRGWHGYVMGNGWRLPSGGGYNVPLPRPYLTNYVESRMIWNEIREKLDAELGSWADAVDFNVFLGDE